MMPPGIRLPECTSDSAKAAIIFIVPIVKAVIAWHSALSLSDLQGVNTTCRYQLSTMPAMDS